jgi:hypothetical protein
MYTELYEAQPWPKCNFGITLIQVLIIFDFFSVSSFSNHSQQSGLQGDQNIWKKFAQFFKK